MFSIQREEETRAICSAVLADLARLRGSMGRIRLTKQREQDFGATLTAIEAVYRDLDDHAARNLAPATLRRRTQPSRRRATRGII